MHLKRYRGPVTFGWAIIWGDWPYGSGIPIVRVIWQPYDDTPPWIPFILDRWQCTISIFDRVIWGWPRWANRYGHA